MQKKYKYNSICMAEKFHLYKHIRLIYVYLNICNQ